MSITLCPPSSGIAFIWPCNQECHVRVISGCASQLYSANVEENLSKFSETDVPPPVPRSHLTRPKILKFFLTSLTTFFNETLVRGGGYYNQKLVHHCIQLLQLQKCLPKWHRRLVKYCFFFLFFFFNTVFVLKAQNFVKFGPYNFVQISLVFGTNIFKEIYEETLVFQH